MSGVMVGDVWRRKAPVRETNAGRRHVRVEELHGLRWATVYAVDPADWSRKVGPRSSPEQSTLLGEYVLVERNGDPFVEQVAATAPGVTSTATTVDSGAALLPGHVRVIPRGKLP